MSFLDELAARRRFGMKPGLETIRALCAALGDPQLKFKAIHVAGTNGKGAVCAILDAALRSHKGNGGVLPPHVGRYTSPHLVRINERFFLDGKPVDDATLERVASVVNRTIEQSSNRAIEGLTFFEALTAVAFLLYAEAKVDYAILECGLGGRLDATNICDPTLSVITRIGLDHCDWLGDTLEKIAAEKAGIIKPGVPVVLGRNEPAVIDVVRRRAEEVGAPFHYAPDLANESEIPADFSLPGAFNRENAVTAIASLKVLAAKGTQRGAKEFLTGFGNVIWPGRFQRVGNFIVDGAHNPPAARALVSSLSEQLKHSNTQTILANFWRLRGQGHRRGSGYSRSDCEEGVCGEDEQPAFALRRGDCNEDAHGGNRRCRLWIAERGDCAGARHKARSTRHDSHLWFAVSCRRGACGARSLSVGLAAV